MTEVPQFPEVSRLWTALAGFVLGAFSLAIAALVLLVGVRALQIGAVSLAGVLAVLCLTTVTYSLGIISWRFVANRPNRYQSIMGPVGWRVCALLWIAAAAFLAYIAAGEKNMQPVGAMLGSVVLGVGSWRKSIAIVRAAGRTAL